MSTFECARGTQSRLLVCTFIIRENALLSSGLSIYEEIYTVYFSKTPHLLVLFTLMNL